jgi:predicted dehydrogenase
MLKALAGIPVLGALGFETFRKFNHDARNDQRVRIIRELGLDDLLDSVRPIIPSRGDLVRIGIIGYGVRGGQLSEALGFMAPDEFAEELAKQAANGDGSLLSQIEHGGLDVAITGICDVFDLHAEKGLAAARNDIVTGGEFAGKHTVKRYRHYQDMLADPDIDAVIIATPDHHHARMTIDAVNAGKHVYCEKAPIHREEEIQPLYEAVTNSRIVYQLGHQNPQNAVFQQAREILDRGLLGKISQVATTTNRNSPSGAWIRHTYNNGEIKPGDAQSIDWQQWLGKAPQVPFSILRYYSWARFSEYDTGLFGQLFSHEFDAVNQLLGLGIPDVVSSTGGQYHYTEFGDIPDVLHTSFEYQKRGITLTYSANLTSSQRRPRTFFGRDASMTVGANLSLTPDSRSDRYAELLEEEVVDSSRPMLEIREGDSISSPIDAVTSASVRYYASRGLTTTSISGRTWDVTHLHLKEWVDCIRHGGVPSTNIDKAFQEAVVLAMADISYREQCRTGWDPASRSITRI